jgi:APA family basic amino acid/polyamine antiporter
MRDLSSTTRHVFTIWMTCAVLIYLLYGLRNSRLNRSAAAPR